MKKKLFLILLVVMNLAFNSAYSQDSVFVYPSMKDLCIEFNSKVAFSDSLIKYNYHVKSLNCSKQPIWQVRVEVKDGSIFIDSPSNWYGTKLESMEYLKNRIITVWGPNDSNNYIYRNGELSGFIVLSLGLPVISKFYITGYVPMPVFPIGEEPEKVINNDVFENSYNDFTIAPGNNKLFEDAPFYFLKNYIDSSFTLGWIKEEATYNKYSEYITKAKTSLETQDTAMAVINLESILIEVDKDSSTALTSEAYALLKFNTVYLVKQLPEVKIENLLDALITKSHESYHTRWIFKYSVYVNIVKRLDNIKKAYLSDRLTSAEYMLDSFLEKLARQRSKGITEEAYEYYKHYVNYIKEKL